MNSRQASQTHQVAQKFCLHHPNDGERHVTSFSTFSGPRPLTSALICTWTASIGEAAGRPDTRWMNAADVCQDVEGIEYHISRSPLEAIDALTKALRKPPLVPAELLKCGRSGRTGALDAKTEIKDRSRSRKYCAERIGLTAPHQNQRDVFPKTAW